MKLQFQKAPLSLKPSPPANTHQLSYTSLMQQKMKQELQISKLGQLLQQIGELHALAYEKDQHIKKMKQQHFQQLLMLQIGLKHQMQITSRYDAEMRRCETSKNQLTHYYEMKLQVIKKDIMESFQSQINTEREKAKEDLRLIRQNYCTKIGLISEANRQREFEMQQREDFLKDSDNNLLLLQGKQISYKRVIEEQQEKQNNLTQQLDKLKQNNYELQKRNRQLQEKQEKDYDNIRKKEQDRGAIQEELKRSFKQALQNLKRSQAKRQELIDENYSLKIELEQINRKYNHAQSQINQINRKTFKNQDFQKGPVGGIMQSERETEQNRERERMKDIKQLRDQNQRLRVQYNASAKALKERQQKIEDLQLRDSSLSIHKESQKIMGLKEEIQHHKRSQVEAKRRVRELEDEIKRIRQTMKQIEQKNRELHENGKNLAEEYERKLQFFIIKGVQTEETFKWQQKKISQLSQRIESNYLKELKFHKKKIEQLDMTLNETHELMMFQAKDKKIITQELEQIKKKYKIK